MIEAASPGRRFWQSYGHCAAVILLFKILYLGGLSLLLLAFPMADQGSFFHGQMLQWTSSHHATFASHFCVPDADYYLTIAADGYQTGAARCAFYPLFPFLVRIGSLFTGGNLLISGMIVANVASLAGCVLLYELMQRRFGRQIAGWTLGLFLAFPGALFFQFIFTESLFFFLLMLLVSSLEHKRYQLAMISALLLPLTRAVGIFCIVPIGLHWLYDTWKAFSATRPNQTGEPVGRARGTIPAKVCNQFSRMFLGNLKGWALFLAPVFGWLGYLFVMWQATGNPFEGFKAQEQFGCESIKNIFDLPHFVSELFSPTTIHGFRGSLLDRCSFVLVACWLPLIWRLDKAWFCWAFFLGVIPAMSGMFVSYTRFAAVVFPLFAVMAFYLTRTKQTRGYLWVIFFLFAALQFVCLWNYVNYR